MKQISTFLIAVALSSSAAAFNFSDLSKIQEYATTSLKVFTSLRKGLEDLTPEEEHFIGRSVTARILADYNPINHIKINDYLNDLGGYLVRFSDRPETYTGYHFQLIQSKEINAFAAPGGFILITSGLYKSLETEEQLAAVLAHEIAHVTLKHGLAAIKTSNLTEAFTLVGQTALEQSGKGRQLGNVRQLTSLFSSSIDDIINKLVVSGYSRDQELEADKESMRILYKSGYNPAGMTQFLAILKSGKGGSFAAGFYNTHPPASERLVSAQSHLEGENWNGKENSRRKKRLQAHVLNK